MKQKWKGQIKLCSPEPMGCVISETQVFMFFSIFTVKNATQRTWRTRCAGRDRFESWLSVSQSISSCFHVICCSENTLCCRMHRRLSTGSMDSATETSTSWGGKEKSDEADSDTLCLIITWFIWKKTGLGTTTGFTECQSRNWPNFLQIDNLTQTFFFIYIKLFMH